MVGREPLLPGDVIPSYTDTTPENYADLLKDRLSDAYQRVNHHIEGQQRNQKKYYDALLVTVHCTNLLCREAILGNLQTKERTF